MTDREIETPLPATTTPDLCLHLRVSHESHLNRRAILDFKKGRNRKAAVMVLKRVLVPLLRLGHPAGRAQGRCWLTRLTDSKLMNRFYWPLSQIEAPYPILAAGHGLPRTVPSSTVRCNLLRFQHLESSLRPRCRVLL